MDAFVMLQELLEQEQFELIFPERSISGQPDIRLVYLMNDAVESFLVFHNARMTGEYRPDYEGEISASVSFEDMEYILVVHQGDSVVTIFFEDLLTDVHLYNYGEIGHFWMKDYEYLRQLEYRLAIMRDKYDYLGGEYCTPEERKLAMLVDFPPLNYCCYPAVPEQYIVPRVEPWVPTEEAIAVMEKLAAEADDKGLLKILKNYRKHPKPYIAKKIAAMLVIMSLACIQLADLKTVKENVFTLIYLMLSTFEKMLRVKLMNGASQAEVASGIGVPLLVARKYINSAKGFSEDSLVWMLRRVAEIDLAIKEGRVEEWNALEQYVAECIYRSHK